MNFVEEMPKWRIDRKTDMQKDKGDFMGPSVGEESNKSLKLKLSYLLGEKIQIWV